MNINQLDTHTPTWWGVRRRETADIDPSRPWIDADFIPIYIPSTPCKIERSNVVGASSGRDESGFMHIDWLRHGVRKVALHYNAITGSELRYMQDLLQGREFRFRFVQDELVMEFDAYAGESNYETYSYGIGDYIYMNYEIHVIEM